MSNGTSCKEEEEWKQATVPALSSASVPPVADAVPQKMQRTGSGMTCM